VLVSYLPVGSEEADKFYAQCAIDAGVAFVNALPVFIASDPEWAAKFEAAGVPIIGDDIKSQVGATITHRVMAKLFEDRGVVLDRTYQLNVGGNMDFKNMLERDRLESKKISKTQAVTSNLNTPAGRRGPQCAHRARPTTCSGSTTASGPTCASRAGRSATCR
jgi:myo-inositol-1-phosphate synthase